MRYYNKTKGYYLPIIGDEPDIIDDNSESERKIKIECVKFFVNNEITKNIGDNFIINHKSSANNKIEEWYTAVSNKTVKGFTTFGKDNNDIKPVGIGGRSIVPMIISNSWDYDGENERFEIPILAPIYANDKITCSLSGKTSDKNVLTIKPLLGIIEVSRKV